MKLIVDAAKFSAAINIRNFIVRDFALFVLAIFVIIAGAEVSS